MRLKITHWTEYRYDIPVHYALQRVRLEPLTGGGQTIVSWSLEIEGAKEEVRFSDHFGNATRLLSVEGEPHLISISASGIVETKDTAGVVGPHPGFAPLWLFCQPTELTTPGRGITEFADGLGEGTDVERLHDLMSAIHEKVAYVPGSTDSATPAEKAVAQKSGVCQDHAHIFIAAARKLGYPARYVSGYLMRSDTIDQAATHAWAEAHIGGLGWVGFDVANEISPDERYVRIAVGRDYRDAMPISGIRLGDAKEELAVSVTVEQ